MVVWWTGRRSPGVRRPSSTPLRSGTATTRCMADHRVHPCTLLLQSVQCAHSSMHCVCGAGAWRPCGVLAASSTQQSHGPGVGYHRAGGCADGRRGQRIQPTAHQVNADSELLRGPRGAWVTRARKEEAHPACVRCPILCLRWRVNSMAPSKLMDRKRLQSPFRFWERESVPPKMNK